ncbi:FUSC family protein [Pseudalkalibacillus caeni]|uniref:Aromatic acid exporter family protein n=1 Tax=Exobacillus caeni TaxID=2574798 RepID=A0A5R9F7E7_9BACL|nr:aromatic acid exporter family protein [Pseudalkalibacillus caeni]TLS35695.1 aromatic acid exporter family protein [Pseudalkalibacillus caeni]
MKLGARILKTGIAITLALYIASLLNLNPPAFAGVAALFAIQPSIYRSYQTILEQIQANIIGAVFAVVFVLMFGNGPFVVGLVAIITIGIMIKLKIEKTIPLAVVTVILIMGTPEESFIAFASNRFLVIMVGVLCSFVVNLVFIPPKYETKLYNKIVSNMGYITQWIRLATRNDAEHKVLKENLNKLKEDMLKSDQYYLLYKEERDYLKKYDYTKGRKLVLFRQMHITNDKALAILKNLDLHDVQLKEMPDLFQKEIQVHLDNLTSYHERILLKYIGKVRNQSPEQLLSEINEGEKSLTEAYVEFYNHKNVEQCKWMTIFPLIGLIIDYSDELEHLDKLVDSFYSYHQDDNEVEINIE